MDMSEFTAPKSAQLTAEDLISGPRTIRVDRVVGTGNGDQPVAIHYDSDEGKPFLPCKTVRRILLAAWGRDASQYPGRSLTLYRDPKVVFGGLAVGGIRVSHMSHIDKPLEIALMATKGKRAPYRVEPLAASAPADTAPLVAPDGRVVQVSRGAWLGGVQRALAALESAGAVRGWRAAMGEHLAAISEGGGGSVVAEAEELIAARLVSFQPADDFPGTVSNSDGTPRE